MYVIFTFMFNNFSSLLCVLASPVGPDGVGSAAGVRSRFLQCGPVLRNVSHASQRLILPNSSARWPGGTAGLCSWRCECRRTL